MEFLKGSRQKLRFNYKGLCAIEDLWDIPKATLNKLYIDLNTELKSHEVEGLFETKSTVEVETLKLKISIIKIVAETRMAEAKAKLNRSAKAEDKKKLIDLLAKKEEMELAELSKEDIQKRIDALG